MAKNNVSGVGHVLFNDPPESITHQASDKFIAAMHSERQKGYGFVPFVGAGFSATSGVPLVGEILPYLHRCICMALGVGDRLEGPWNPRTHQWPPLVDRNPPGEPQAEQDMTNKLLSILFGKNKLGPNRSLVQEALGAMADWRTALSFLSRIVRASEGGTLPRDVVSLDAHQQEVTDACLRELVKGKHPSLGHRMLGLLAGGLRLDLVLTTNFDDLLEAGFASARNPVEVYEVHLGSSFPHWSVVSSTRSLIKLHGNRHSLRADYSLDGLPSESDKTRFLEYLLSGKGRLDLEYLLSGKDRLDLGRKTERRPGLEFQNHLLMIGSSGVDRRTRTLIQHAWKHLDPNFKVFWLCYSAEDVKRIENLSFQSRREDQGETGEPKCPGSHILRHTSFDLLLLQMYQTIRRNLPPLGGLFPSVSRLTLPPLQTESIEDKTKDKTKAKTGPGFCDELQKRLEFVLRPNESNKLIVATSKLEVHGLTSACAKVFRKLEESNICLWLDMNDISSTDNLFEVLLEAAHFRLGMEHWTPAYLAADMRPRAKELRRVTRLVNSPWIIFLNARETPGANTASDPYGQVVSTTSPNGWLDAKAPPINEDPSACVGQFLELLKELYKPEPSEPESSVAVVLLCRQFSGEPMPGKDTKEPPLIDAIIEKGWGHCLLHQAHDSPDTMEDFREDDVCAKAIQWATDDSKKTSDSKKRFLHSLVLMQRPRLLATIWGPAVSLPPPGPKENAAERSAWVDDLEDTGLVRRKAGGFIWIHARCRETLRAILRKPDVREGHLAGYENVLQVLKHWNPAGDEPKIHAALAEWYEQVLDASDAPAAALEMAYHYCRSAETKLELAEGDRANAMVWASEKVDAATASLKAHGFLIQTNGYSRGSCRRLEHIRDTLCDWIRKFSLDQQSEDLRRSLTKLRVTCTEVMRAIAREVGEDGEAYQRHQEYVTHLTGQQIKDVPEAFSSAMHDALFGAGDVWYGGTAEWIRWRRWCGMLAIASRSFTAAESALGKALSCLNKPDGLVLTPENIEAELNEWECRVYKSEVQKVRLQPGDGATTKFQIGVCKSEVQKVRLQLLRALEQYVALQLLKDSVEQRLDNITEFKVQSVPDISRAPVKDGDEDRIRAIEDMTKLGFRLVRRVQSQDHSSDSHNASEALWCKSRFLMHQSVCWVRRVQLDPDKKDETLQNPMGLLGDAEASLGADDVRRYRADLAMVELHRAEARLREAESLIIPLRAGPVSLGRMCRLLELIPAHGPWRCGTVDHDLDTHGEFQDKFIGPEVGPQGPRYKLRKAKSLVTDGIRFLNRAEPALRERRRNVWWTTWFFERRLRAIALSIWASVIEEGTPIPFLGLEAAIHDTDTAADLTMADALLMIRVDAYRLATIIDAYTSCVKAFHMRVRLQAYSRPDGKRLMRMNENLRGAIRELKEVKDRRDNAPSASRNDKSKMAEDVLRYVQMVEQRSTALAEELGKLY